MRVLGMCVAVLLCWGCTAPEADEPVEDDPSWIDYLAAEALSRHGATAHLRFVSPGEGIQAAHDSLPDDGNPSFLFALPGEHVGRVHLRRENTQLIGCTLEAEATYPWCWGPRPDGEHQAAVIVPESDTEWRWGEGVVEFLANGQALRRVTIDQRYPEYWPDTHLGANAVAVAACDRDWEAFDRDEVCEHEDRIDDLSVTDNVFVNIDHFGLNLNNVSGEVLRNDLRGSGTGALWGSGSDGEGGAHLVIQDNLLAGNWGGMAFSPATWNRLTCDVDSGDCAFGPASLTVEASDNQFLDSAGGFVLYLEPYPHHGGLSPGVHTLEIMADDNAFGGVPELIVLGGQDPIGLTSEIEITLANNTWAGDETEGWDLTDKTTHIDLVDQDGLLLGALLTDSTCGADSSLDIYDGSGTRVGGCPPVVE